MGKVSLAVKGIVNNTVGGLRKLFEFVGKGLTASSEKQESSKAGVDYAEHNNEVRQNSVRCVFVGPQSTIVCYDQYTGRLL